MNENIEVLINGHCLITDDLGTVLLDQTNAIHPQNMARVIARALSNESNYFINRIAFGNGGTITDVAYNTTFKRPNDGQTPDINTFDSRLYNETFSKIINEGTTENPNLLIGVDPGSADSNRIRLGGGSSPTSDMPSTPHISGPGIRSTELGLTSKVTIYATLNKDEPKGQYLTDMVGTTSPLVEETDSLFTFDEIGLYTAGGPAIDMSGYHHCDVGNKTSQDIALYYDNGQGSNIGMNTYRFGYRLSNNPSAVTQYVQFTIPDSYSTIDSVTYGELCEAINSHDPAWNFGTSILTGCKLIVTDTSSQGAYPTIVGSQTNGYLTLVDDRVGPDSFVEFIRTPTTGDYLDLFSKLNMPTGGDIISNAPVIGTSAGYQNSPTTPLLERERLLAHLIFSPIRKVKNRRLNIIYTLTVNVTRTPNKGSTG